MDKKRVYTFGNGQAEGKAGMRNLLGGKGANLAEMNLIGVPVPPGFTITTDVCTEYYELGQDKVVALLKDEVEKAIANVEVLMKSKFGDIENPLLVSVRSGARASMPGMMDTILNLGLNDEVVEGLTRKTGNARFAWDSYRRFVQMYGDVVLGMKPVNKEDVDPFEAIIEEVKHAKGVKLDNQLEVEDLKELVKRFKAAVKEQTGKDFPTCAYEQLWGAICAVFNSWMNERAILYRKMEGIPDEWGTAVSVQAMVFGNMGDTSATGVCFSRDAATGEDLFNGEYLINAQGEDVVAGIRTPQQITKIGSQRWAVLAGVTEEVRAAQFPSMEEAMPEIYKQLDALQTKLENHYRDMQDMEFTVQEGKLWFLQTRNGKRTGAAMVKIAMDLLHQGMIDEKTALMRVEPNKLDELLHPVFDKNALKQAKVLTRGLPASPGAATGQIVFFADDAAEWAAGGKKVVMVRVETSPEDLAGMAVAQGILTARGGMTSHAAVVARGMGKCCVSGAGALNIDYKARTVEVDGVLLKEGDYISLNGSTGEVYQGKVETKAAELSGDFAELMALADKYTKLQVRTNADTPHDAKVARDFGAVSAVHHPRASGAGGVTMWFYWIIVPLAWLVWHIAFRIRVIGRENLIHDRGFVIAPNHISAIDPVFVVIARFWGRPMVIMAKEELFEISRLLNWAWRHVGVVCVRRGKGDATVVENTVREVREGRGALVFPEGTRTKDGNLGKLKSGAFVIAAEAGVDMIPCRIIYKGGKMRVFGRCTVVFGKPIPAEKLKLGEPRSAARLRECKALLAEELEKLLEENRQYL